jgi:hypothetical protein
VELSVNWTVSGLSPLVGDAVKSATGGSGMITVTESSAESLPALFAVVSRTV